MAEETLKTCFSIFYPGFGKSSCISPHGTSSEPSLDTLFVFYSTSFRVLFPYVLLDSTIHSACDVLCPLCWVPPPTGTFWSSLLFYLHPAKYVTVVYKKTYLVIQKCMYKQKEIRFKCLFYNCFIQSKFKPNIFFPLKMGGFK